MSLTSGIDKAYHLIAEGESASILANFSSDFIYNVTNDLLEDRFKDFSLIPKINIVDKLESAFKFLLSQYPYDRNNILVNRFNVYSNIINIISNKTGVRIYSDGNTDIYNLARSVFDFFISSYDSCVFNFLLNFIYEQKDAIYMALDLEKSKKSKDITTMYNKQMYSDIEMAIINANLDKVLNYIGGMDVPSYDVLRRIYANNTNIHTLNFMSVHVDMDAPLFDLYIKPVLYNPILYPILLTNIKLEIQRNGVTIVNSFNPQDI